MRRKPSKAPARKTFKVYVPEQAGDLSSAVEAAAERLGLAEKRKITTSDWIIMSITEKLERDVIPPSIRAKVPGLTVDRIGEMLVWANPGVGWGLSADFASAAKQAEEISRLRISGGQLCSLEVSLALDEANWLIAHGSKETKDRSQLRHEALRHAGLLS